jgi:hypothetical protein
MTSADFAMAKPFLILRIRRLIARRQAAAARLTVGRTLRPDQHFGLAGGLREGNGHCLVMGFGISISCKRIRAIFRVFRGDETAVIRDALFAVLALCFLSVAVGVVATPICIAVSGLEACERRVCGFANAYSVKAPGEYCTAWFNFFR